MPSTWRTSTTGNVASTSIVVTEPTGKAAGDYQFVLIAVGTAATTVATPAGWFLEGTSGAGTNSRYYVFSVIGGRGAGAPGLTFTASTASSHEWHCLGVASPSWVVDAAAASALTSGTTPDPPSATATRQMGVSIAIGFNFAGAAWTAPGGYTLRSVNSGTLDCVAASKDLTIAGPENPAVFTGPGSSNDIWAMTIILRGAARFIEAHRPAPFSPSSATLRGF